MNDIEGKSYKNINNFSRECIENCYKNILCQELDIMKPKVIFAVGSAVESWIQSLTKNEYFIRQLPHPAGQQRGFRNDYYRVLYFWLVLSALNKSGIFTLEQSSAMAKDFLANF
jgi:hypothetical protein